MRNQGSLQRRRRSTLVAIAMAGAPLLPAETDAAAPLNITPSATATRADATSDEVATDLQLFVNLDGGDVSLDNFASGPTQFTEYSIFVLDKSTRTLLVGNPADVSKGTGPANLAPRTKTPPYTKELLLAEASPSSPSYNSSAAALGNTPSTWSVLQDGYNGATSSFGLAEQPSIEGVSDAITIPAGGSIDLGTIFNTFASHTDLQFKWSPATSDGGNYTGNPYTGTVDYGYPVPEPGGLGQLVLNRVSGGDVGSRVRSRFVLGSFRA